MKILVVNLTKMVDDSGGLAKVTCAFSNGMKRRGHTVSLVYSDEKIVIIRILLGFYNNILPL